MLETVNAVDHQIFEWIQENLRNPALDQIITPLRDKHFWIPIYIFFISYIFFNFKKEVWRILFYILVLATLSDQTSSSMLKKNIKRIRPCNEEIYNMKYTPSIGCSAGFSFPSSHATNHAALSMFLILLLKDWKKSWKMILGIWPMIIGFAQIYIGVHFPMDVLFGFILGTFLAILVFYFYKETINWSGFSFKPKK